MSHDNEEQRSSQATPVVGASECDQAAKLPSMAPYCPPMRVVGAATMTKPEDATAWLGNGALLQALGLTDVCHEQGDIGVLVDWLGISTADPLFECDAAYGQLESEDDQALRECYADAPSKTEAEEAAEQALPASRLLGTQLKLDQTIGTNDGPKLKVKLEGYWEVWPEPSLKLEKFEFTLDGLGGKDSGLPGGILDFKLQDGQLLPMKVGLKWKIAEGTYDAQKDAFSLRVGDSKVASARIELRNLLLGKEPAHAAFETRVDPLQLLAGGGMLQELFNKAEPYGVWLTFGAPFLFRGRIHPNGDLAPEQASAELKADVLFGIGKPDENAAQNPSEAPKAPAVASPESAEASPAAAGAGANTAEGATKANTTEPAAPKPKKPEHYVGVGFHGKFETKYNEGDIGGDREFSETEAKGGVSLILGINGDERRAAIEYRERLHATYMEAALGAEQLRVDAIRYALETAHPYVCRNDHRGAMEHVNRTAPQRLTELVAAFEKRTGRQVGPDMRFWTALDHSATRPMKTVALYQNAGGEPSRYATAARRAAQSSELAEIAHQFLIQGPR